MTLLVFPNLQYLEGKTICQTFMIDVLKHMETFGVKILALDMKNMEAQIEGEIDLDHFFADYAEKVAEESMANYSFTMNRLRMGQTPRNLPNTRFSAETLTRLGAPESGGIERQEKGLAFRLDNLWRIKDTGFRPFQTVDEVASGKNACPACGLVDGGRATITDDISLSADKARLGLPGPGYVNLTGCKRCAIALKAVSALKLLWRIVFIEKRGSDTLRHTFVPIFPADRTDPGIMQEMDQYLAYLSNFRAFRRGRTEIDFIYNCFRMQPILAKLVEEGELGFTYYSRSGSGIKTSVTDSVRDAERVRSVAQFAHTLNTYLPRDRLHAFAEDAPGTTGRIVSDSVRLYVSKSREDGFREFSWRMAQNGRGVPFSILVEITALQMRKEVRQMAEMKKEYLLDTSTISDMDEFWWDNPLVRLSTLLVAELTGTERAKGQQGRPPDQVINQCMSELDEFPESEKAVRVRRYVERITNKGDSYIVRSVKDPVGLLNAFQKALYACTPRQLKEIVRNMRIYAMSYIYEKKEAKQRIVEETVSQLGLRLKVRESKAREEV